MQISIIKKFITFQKCNDPREIKTASDVRAHLN